MDILQRWRGKEHRSLSHYLQDGDTWDVRCERNWRSRGVFTAIASDPVLDVLAIGDDLGNIEVFGARALSTTWTLPDGGKARFLGISPTECCLLCLDTLERLHVYDLNSTSDSPLVSVLVPKGVNFLCIPPSHGHLFLPYPDGSVHAFDVSRLKESPYVIPLRASSAPTEQQKELSSMVMDIAQHPVDPNLLFLAYEDTLILWDIGERRPLLELVPTTGPPPVITAIVVHPNGRTLISGHIDGTVMMWCIGETSNLCWRGNLKQLYASSTKQAQTSADADEGTDTEDIEPVFKLLWASSNTDAVQLFVLGGGTSTQPRLSSITFPSVPVASGNLDPKGLHFQFHPQIDPTPVRDFVLIPPSRPENILILQNEVSISSISPQSTQANIPFCLLPPITHSHLLTIDRGDHSRLSAFISEAEAPLASLPLGGVLRTENSAETADTRRVKYQPRQLILTYHHDHQLRFHDISPHLISSSPPLDTAYPNPLTKLTIDIRAPLEDSFIWSTLDSPPEEMRVQSVVVARRSSECGVVFQGGEVILWGLRDEGEGEKENTEVGVPTGEVLLDLRLVESDGRAWRPKMLFNPKEGRCMADALCDVGFLALGYEKSLYVIDLRGPRVVLQHPCVKRKSGGADSFTVLSWIICGLNESTAPSLHLFAGTASGTIQVLTLIHVQGSWSVDPNILTLPPIDNLTNLTTLTVVDATTGEELTASPERLLVAMKGAKANGVYWIVATASELRCMDGISANRIGKASFPVGVGAGAKEVGVVRHADSTALMVFLSGGSVIAYSIPGLQPLLHHPTDGESGPSELLLPDPSSISISTTGHALVFSRPQCELTLWRLFYEKRTPLPVLRFAPPVKEHRPRGSGILGWISSLGGGGGEKVMSEGVDAILAGPNRPPARVRSYETAIGVGEAEEDPYGRMIRAAQERGERLADMAERTKELEDASHSFATQAKKLAGQQQQQNNWFGF